MCTCSALQCGLRLAVCDFRQAPEAEDGEGEEHDGQEPGEAGGEGAEGSTAPGDSGDGQPEDAPAAAAEANGANPEDEAAAPADGAADGAAGEGGEEGDGAEGDEPPAPPAPKYVRRVISVPKVVSKLNVALGSLPEELSVFPVFYFILNRSGHVAAEELDSAVEFGLLSEGPSLRILEQMLSSVFVPILVQMSGGDVASGGVLMQSMTDNSHRELLGNMQKFHSQVTQALQQLTGDVTLQVRSADRPHV